MPKRVIRVTKWLGMIPAVGVCSACGKEFKVPVASLSRLQQAKEILQSEFDRHVCSTSAERELAESD
jgi:hypothetical protein